MSADEKLAEKARAAGWAAKIGPGDLALILQGLPEEKDPRLLVGAGTSDDAGVYLLNETTALIQTLDFFTPIVNDPLLFGQIAAANALSDVYAMGGKPICAMNICCFPVKSHPPSVFRRILEGGLLKVHEAGAVLAGGHSVDDEDLKYGLSVTGVVHPDKLVTNAGLKPGQLLVLTKPLGTGIIATALKAGLAGPETMAQSVAAMTQLNSAAGEVMAQTGVTGATDISGFGLLGHGLELAQASGVKLVIQAGQVPVLPQAREMASMGLVPLGSHANRGFCSQSLTTRGEADPIFMDILADAQTSGGMLMGLDADKAETALARLADSDVSASVIGLAEEGPAGVIEVVFD